MKRCARKTKWNYRDGLVKKVNTEATKADLGTLVHTALQHYYESGTNPVATVEAKELQLSIENPAEALLQKDNYTLGKIMLRGYIEWLAETGADAGLTVTGVERELVVPFGEVQGVQVFLTGKFDLEVVDGLGRPLLFDHKTVAAIATDPMELMDEQRLTYSVLRRMDDGVVYQGAIHNQLRRVKRTATAKPPFYARTPITFNDTQLRNHYRHMQSTVDGIVSAALAYEQSPDQDTDEHLLYPPNPTRDCKWDCRFRDICVLRDDGSDWEWVRDNWYTGREEVAVNIG